MNNIERISNRTLTVGASSIILSARLSNGQRSVLFISNTSTAGQKVSIAAGQEAIVGQGITIGAGGFYQDSLSDGYFPTNEDISVISDAVGATLSIQERVIMQGY